MTTNKRQEALQQKIIETTAQIIHEKHLYHIGLRRSKPSYNQLYKLCAEYIDLGLQNIKSKYQMEIIPIRRKDAITIDERIPNIMKVSIVEYVVYEYSFSVVRGSKRKYKITASGIVKEGSEAKLPDDFIAFYVGLCGLVNELLDYGCLMAINQLHHSGVLYIDVPLMEMLDDIVKSDNVTLDQLTLLYTRFDDTIHTFISDEIDCGYSLNLGAKVKPILRLDFIESGQGSNVVELMYNKGKYDTVRTTGNTIDENIIDGISRFILATDTILTEKIQEHKQIV